MMPSVFITQTCLRQTTYVKRSADAILPDGTNVNLTLVKDGW
jgi:endonuclease YncB( thermonuclease family)